MSLASTPQTIYTHPPKIPCSLAAQHLKTSGPGFLYDVGIGQLMLI